MPIPFNRKPTNLTRTNTGGRRDGNVRDERHQAFEHGSRGTSPDGNRIQPPCVSAGPRTEDTHLTLTLASGFCSRVTLSDISRTSCHIPFSMCTVDRTTRWREWIHPRSGVWTEVAGPRGRHLDGQCREGVALSAALGDPRRRRSSIPPAAEQPRQPRHPTRSRPANQSPRNEMLPLCHQAGATRRQRPLQSP